MRPVAYIRLPDSRQTKTYQQYIFEILKFYFKEEVKMEWCIGVGATDVFSRKHIYAPRLDIAVGPFNIHVTDYNKINLGFARATHFIDKLFKAKNKVLDVTLLNKNPRCVIAVEISFSGSSKHILGDFANASMMGLLGIVITSKRNYTKVSRMANYLDIVSKIGKAPEGMFSNILVFEADEFIDLFVKKNKV